VRVLAFGYIRLSRFEETTTSPARQREIVEDLCRQRGWELVDVFEDLNVSGGKESRRGLDTMLARLADVDAVVTWKLDRLARSLPHLLKLGERFEAAGVQLVTADGEVDTTSAGGRAFFQMRGVFAEFERRTVGERARSTHAFLRAQDRVQSRTPFGFRVNGERRLERNPDTWPTLVSIMERVAAGDSLNQLGREYGQPHTTIRVWVRNRKALALLEQDRPDLVDALRSRFESSFKPGARGLLSGLATCAVCGSKMRQGRRDGRRIYECKQKGHVRVDADFADAHVVNAIHMFIADRLPRRHMEPAPREDRTKVERLLTELEDDYDAGLVSRERFVERRARLLERLERAGAAAPRPRLETVSWDSLSHVEQRLALREMLAVLEVGPIPKGQARAGEHPERLSIGWRDDAGVQEVVPLSPDFFRRKRRP
jgi:DNA invertase Pin-like site-specific DNA recombinase